MKKWKATIDNATGLMIESQSAASSDAAMLGNAERAGFSDVSIILVTEVEHDALIAARYAA